MQSNAVDVIGEKLRSQCDVFVCCVNVHLSNVMYLDVIKLTPAFAAESVPARAKQRLLKYRLFFDVPFSVNPEYVAAVDSVRNAPMVTRPGVRPVNCEAVGSPVM
jgi:hypothetical protein